MPKISKVALIILSIPLALCIVYFLYSGLLYGIVYFVRIGEPKIIPAELVLKEGANLTAKNGNLEIIISAGKGLDRTYTYGGCSLESDMRPRRSRWFGNMGIYDHAARFGISFGKSCDGISRTVVQEGQIHFRNENLANEWLQEKIKRQSQATFLTTFDGLVVEFYPPSIPRRQMNVDLWQVCINGKRPKALYTENSMIIDVTPSESRIECITVPENVYEETQNQFRDEWKFQDENNKRVNCLKEAKDKVETNKCVY